MKISVEISKYPLADEFIPAIKAFIERLNEHENVTIITNTMSTQIFGDIDIVMPLLHQEMKKSFETYGKQVFVCKFFNKDLTPK
ncbi:hypothetical protein [Algicola sagamiensis]|uniref:hypothetical protein n=1 Tax=Algicola sagamiensis TaxID=163869 RepID=UPI0003661674|nr:hypothetical protein [Algicola sagamiensis]